MRDFITYRKPVRGKRAAFTLIEILVVIGIIGILAGITAVAVFKVIVGQRASNTRTSMATVQKVLATHWAQVIEEARKETGLDDVNAKLDYVFGADPTGGPRNKILWIKARLMEAFPMTYYEIRNPWINAIIPPARRKFAANYQTAIASLPGDKLFDRTKASAAQGSPSAHATESSACLLIALSVPRNGASLTADMLGSTNVADTDGDGIKEIVDGWGNPISFFRFPTNNKALQDSFTPTAGRGLAQYADPLDPEGILVKQNTFTAAGKANFEKFVHRLASPFGNATCYVVPTLVSWGPDGALKSLPDPPGGFLAVGSGLDLNQPIANATMAVVDPTQDADNIYSFQLR